ncbi:hornerin-like [Melitaea cinxia]|uniref:hornerin-like n=1 Tax=Melitaea cinxia TaxID=113334 RepID=UPI001E274172|nr:hornerin-like [Melitaea cinxia]
MKFTVVFITLLTVSSTWGIKARIEEPKDKREAGVSYLPSHGSSSHAYNTPATYSAPSANQLEASAVSIGAGYSVGGAKPSYSFGDQGSGATYQLQQEGLPGSGHATIQLSPITLQPGHGLVSSDLSQLMSQLSHGINSGAIAIPSSGGQLYQFVGQAGQGGHAAQEYVPQFSYGSPNFQQYSLGEQSQPAVPSYALGTKGLGTYGSAGPVLFSPESSGNQAALNYAAPASGHSYEGAALPLGDSGNSLSGFSFGGSGHTLGSLKGISGYAGKSSFKPSTFLGASVQSDSGLTGSFGSPSFSNYQASAGTHGGPSFGSAGHGLSFGSLSAYAGGSPKGLPHSYLPSKSEGYGSLESIASAFSASGQIASPLGTTYGSPFSSYSTSNTHAASAPSPTYYVTSHKHSSPSSSSGSSSYRGPISSQHSSFSAGPKYSFGGHSSSRYASPKDTQGAYSESSYNTIKYSEELKPRHH